MSPEPSRTKNEPPPPAPSRHAPFAATLATEEEIDLDTAERVISWARNDTSTRFSGVARLRSSPDYRAVAIAAVRREEATAAADDRRCPHGRVDGTKVLGRGAATSRLCPDCEIADPAPDLEAS